MEQKPLSLAQANEIYSILVENLNSLESEREKFTDYFTGKYGEVFHEYRITGKLNPGSKFRYFGLTNMYVDFYTEVCSASTLKEKEHLAAEVNTKLKKFNS